MWEKSFKDLDGDGNVSEGDFTQEELSMSNGSKTFKDYLGGIMGKPWKLAENVITNIKAMFIKSAPANTVKSQGASEIIDYIKENKLKVGDTFEYNGIKYTVGQNNTAIAQADNYESKIETYSDGKTSISTYMEDQMNTTVTDENNNKISERSDYDDGSAQIKIYENGQQSADITIRAPKSENEIPFIRIRE